MKKIVAISIFIATTLFAGPPVPNKPQQGPITKFECVNSENYSYDLIVKKGIDKMSPVFIIVEGEEIVVADMMMFAMFESVIEEKASGTYKGEKYYTIGVQPNISNCSKK